MRQPRFRGAGGGWAFANWESLLGFRFPSALTFKIDVAATRSWPARRGGGSEQVQNCLIPEEWRNRTSAVP